MKSYSNFWLLTRSLTNTKVIKHLVQVSLLGFVFSSISCNEASQPPPAAPVTDTEPVGSGLKVIGFAVLGASVVCVLGKMLD